MMKNLPFAMVAAGLLLLALCSPGRLTAAEGKPLIQVMPSPTETTLPRSLKRNPGR